VTVVRNLVFVVVMIALLVGLIGLGVVGLVTGPSPATVDSAGDPAVLPPATVTLDPAASTRDVAPGRPATVTVAHGRIVSAALVGPAGPVAGAVTPDGRTWASTAPLAYGASYTYSGTAVGEDARTVPLGGVFTTVDPAQTTRSRLNIGDGETVGVAAPIVVQFDHHVADKAAAERSMQVRTSIPTVGSWAWLDDDNGGSRAHWRPKDYWTPGTQVSVSVDQFGVNDGGGVWGRENVGSTFTIGRSQIVRADVTSHQMVVVRDGQQVMDFPASYGLGSDPNRNTTNGVHVVMSKSPTVLMSNPAYGYTDVEEHWAVRIANNGEFIHANPDTTGDQGSDNVTHGCVNLSTADAHAYFDTALFGDPVEVTGSPIPLTPADGDISDWTVPWDRWVRQSATAT
jgi:lipoprotein-anchoring transpeptidase ErfK/SrfK